MTTTYDAIIVGTGIGGLTTGLALAKKGHSVLLLEAGKQFGGMLNPFARKKYHFDVGIHYVGEAGEKQAMRRTLDWLGLDDIRFREINPDCIDRYVFDGYEAKLVKGIDRWEALLVADFPHQRDAIGRFTSLMRACTDLSRLTQGKVKPRQVASVLRHSPGLVKLLHQPFSKVLAHYFDDPLLRAVFAGPGGDIGVPPSRASALTSIMVLNHFLGGAYYPIGGSGAIRDSFVNALKEQGAELKRNSLVTSIEALSTGGFAVTTAKGDRYEARSVTSNVDARHTLDMLEGARPNWLTRRKAKNLVPSLGSFCLFIGTDLDLAAEGLTDANIWHYGDHDIDAGYAKAYSGQLADDPFFFMTAPTLKDPETVRAPKGHHTLELISFVPSEPFKPWFDKPAMKRGEEYARIKDGFTEKLLTAAERYLPTLRDHIILKEAATPATVWHFVRGRNGGIYGPEHSPEQSFPRRFFPGIGVPGLYLAGASVMGAGIMTCLMSGVMAADQAKKFLGESRRTVRPASAQKAKVDTAA